MLSISSSLVSKLEICLTDSMRRMKRNVKVGRRRLVQKQVMMFRGQKTRQPADKAEIQKFGATTPPTSDWPISPKATACLVRAFQLNHMTLEFHVANY